jgi:hypothetical protein
MGHTCTEVDFCFGTEGYMTCAKRREGGKREGVREGERERERERERILTESIQMLDFIFLCIHYFFLKRNLLTDGIQIRDLVIRELSKCGGSSIEFVS